MPFDVRPGFSSDRSLGTSLAPGFFCQQVMCRCLPVRLLFSDAEIGIGAGLDAWLFVNRVKGCANSPLMESLRIVAAYSRPRLSNASPFLGNAMQEDEILAPIAAQRLGEDRDRAVMISAIR